MGGIQNESTRPGDPTFSQRNNNYNTLSFTRMREEFRIELGLSRGPAGPEADHSITYPERKNFCDEGGKYIKGSLIYFIRKDNTKVERQFDFFIVGKSEGLTQAGMARLD